MEVNGDGGARADAGDCAPPRPGAGAVAARDGGAPPAAGSGRVAVGGAVSRLIPEAASGDGDAIEVVRDDGAGPFSAEAAVPPSPDGGGAEACASVADSV